MRLIIRKTILFFCFLNITLYSQTHEFKVTEYSSKQGLSQSVVNCVLQDSRGFVWAGTQDGLNRFDGYKFKVYKHDPVDSSSISNSSIWKIYEDSENNLWIGTYGGGLNFYDYQKDVFIRYKHSESNSNSINGNDVRAIYEDANGFFWIGTNNGLNRFDYLNNKWEDFSKGGIGVLPFKNIRDIYPHSNNEFWLSSYGNGLIYFNIETKKSKLYCASTTEPFSISNNNVWKTFKDSRGVYWILTFGGGLNQFNFSDYTPMESIKFTQFRPKDIAKDVTEIFENSKGEIFIGTDTDGLLIIDSTRKKIDFIRMDVLSKDGITNNGVWSICQNNSGNYWLGTFGGGLNFLEMKIPSFSHISTDSFPASLNNPIVFNINRLNKDEFLIGTYGGGVNKLSMKMGKEQVFTTNNSNIVSNYITEIVIENDSTYWFGSDGKGISKYNPINNVFTNYDVSNTKKLASNFVKCMMMDSYKNIWVGTLKGFCVIQNVGNAEGKFYSDSFLNVSTRALLELEPGKILLGTHGEGVIIHDIQKNSFEKIANPLVSNKQVTELYLDKNILWIGTRGSGLIKYNFVDDKAELLTEKNGLPNNTILGIEQDNLGKLWIITNNGISKYDINSHIFTNYYTVDGLLSNEFVQGAIYKDDDGIIYAGNIKGVEIINPNNFIPNTFDPQLEITNLTIMNEEHSIRELLDSRLELTYMENFVKIDFASLDFTNPTKNLYRYRLTPGNNEWINLGTEHSVNFANLKPAKYLLELNGSNSDGVWGLEIKRLNIIVNPPFYNTYLFYILVLFVVGFIIYRFYYINLKKKMELERLRLKIASDLHDEVGSSLTQISINADLINYENDLEKIKTKCNLIRAKSGEMINVLNDVIWSIDSRNDKLESLVERIKSAAAQLAASKEIELKFKTDIQNPNKKLHVDFRQNIFLIVKESVNNSVKYSKANLISIDVLEKDANLKIIIADNGIGLPDEYKSSGSGIKNIKHRIENINGKVEFINNPGLIINIEVKIN